MAVARLLPGFFGRYRDRQATHIEEFTPSTENVAEEVTEARQTSNTPEEPPGIEELAQALGSIEIARAYVAEEPTETAGTTLVTQSINDFDGQDVTRATEEEEAPTEASWIAQDTIPVTIVAGTSQTNAEVKQAIHAVQCNKLQPYLPSPKSMFLEMPLELMASMTKELGLHDQFHLSHTCTAMHSLLTRTWNVEITQLPQSERLGFLLNLSFHLPGYWTCRGCYSFHRVDPSDTPKSPRLRLRTPYCDSAIHLFPNRLIFHRHVQTALKYDRMGLRESHIFKQLMAPRREVSYILEPCLHLYIRARPSIINGCFILYEEWDFQNMMRITKNSLSHYSIRFCPHLFVDSLSTPIFAARFCGEQDPCLPTLELNQTLNFALGSRGNEVSHYCRRCPTDSMLLVSPHKLLVKIWHDFGPYSSPLDLSWDAHVLMPRDAPSGPSLSHSEGSIRVLLTSGAAQQSELNEEMA